MAGIQLVTPSGSLALPISEVKNFLRLDEDTDDAIIISLIKSAESFAEEYTHRSLLTKTFKFSIDGISEGDIPLWEGLRVGPDLSIRRRAIELPNPPLVSVTSVVAFDDADVATTFAASKYYVDSARVPARIILRNGERWPTALRVGNAVEITYTAGYGDASSSIPEPIRLAMLQYCAFMYEHRGEAERSNAGVMTSARPQLPVNMHTLLSPFVVHNFSSNMFENEYHY